MNWWTIFLGLLLALAVLLALLFMLELERLHFKYTRLLLKCDAQQWLAEYHAQFTFALQDYVIEREDVNLPTLMLKIREYRRLAARRRFTLYLPMGECPLVLRHAAQVYNEDVRTAWKLPWQEEDGGSFHAAEHVARALTTDLTRYTERIGGKVGLEPTVVGVILDELELLLDREVKRLTGPVEPNEVLPKEY